MADSNPEQDYFHINRVLPYSRHPLLRTGDVIEIGHESNPYFRVYETSRKAYSLTAPDGQNVSVPGVKFLGGVRRGEIDCPRLPVIAHELATHLAGLVGELIWEDVRQREFPGLPSRQRCVWLVPDLEAVRYWLERLGPGASAAQVVRVRCAGRVHVASESHLVGDSVPIEEAALRARRYWRGELPDTGREEIIFEGRLTVLQVLDPAQYA